MKVIKECGAGLFSTLAALEAELSEVEFRKIEREIGRVISVMDEAISAKLRPSTRTGLEYRHALYPRRT